jgi:hypothetical protein
MLAQARLQGMQASMRKMFFDLSQGCRIDWFCAPFLARTD